MPVSAMFIIVLVTAAVSAIKTRRSDVAERPHNALCRRIFC